jgi:rhodanese-related sulfurtransferase|tara:strand:+ start:355 stop:570 length:216 start_codon:yes stop_codon:yes gene_type:complete
VNRDSSALTIFNNPSGLKEVIAYCRGPFCLLAFEAVKQLRSKGYKARRLEDGFPEWKLDGLPIEKGFNRSN